ncbi:DsbA family oxidoreductase [Mesobacterium pallidum]|uniref:DsbA family oxidoreductase n=1 Tax=Mesobacterium pallidum TaxID=2872037 RepID=UPI001EE266AE|nr:DsbA family oxidoreductase [Mesobacterium pallidum]
MTKSIRIDFVSDVVCPWCIVAHGQLQEAALRTGIPLQIHWHPFELNPSMPPSGQDMRSYLATKYGITPEQSARNRAQLIELGAEVGFAFSYPQDMRVVNTFHAHQLIDWARIKGDQALVKMALFRAYFTENRDVSDLSVLAELAEECGLDGAEAQEVLARGERAADVRAMQQFWLAKGIDSAPSLVFQQKYLVTGAQGIEGYTELLTELHDEHA